MGKTQMDMNMVRQADHISGGRIYQTIGKILPLMIRSLMASVWDAILNLHITREPTQA